MLIRKLTVSSFKKAIRYDSCANPGISSGGGRVGWVQVHLAYKKSSDNVFWGVFLVYRSPVVTFKKTIICHGSSGGGTF